MTDMTPEGGEPLSSAGSGLGGETVTGTNGLKQSIDSNTREIGKVSQAFGKFEQTIDRLVSGFTGGGGGSTNGGHGGPTYRHADGTPYGTTSHRSPGYAQVGAPWSGTPNGGAHRGTPSASTRVAVGAAAAYGAYKAGSAFAGFMSNPDEASQARAIDATTSYFAPGRSMSIEQVYGSRTAHDTADLTKSVAMLASQSAHTMGTGGFQRHLQGATGASLINPMISNTQAVQGALGLSAAGTFNMLRGIGVETIRDGQAQNPRSIANQILQTIPGANQIKTMDQMVAALSQNGGINQTLMAWVAGGQLPAESYETVKTEIRGILTARVRGNMDFAQYNRLSERAGRGDQRATQALRRAGVGASSLQQEREQAAEERTGSLRRVETFNEGLRDASKALTKFRDVINDIIPDWMSAVTGRLKGQFDLRVFGGLAGLLGMGGSTETRMSMAGGTMGGASMAPAPGFGGPRAGTTRSESRAPQAGQGTGAAGRGKRGGGKAGTRLQWPCRGPITARFGQSGSNWSSGHHTGLDIGVPAGTPVKAAADGKVREAGWNSAYGNQLVIDHGNGIETQYAHNNRLKVSKGDSVRAGQVVAYSGATGNTTGPHLHFEVRISGKQVDPEKYLGASGATLDINSPGGSGAAASSSGGESHSDTGAGSGQAFAMGFSTSEAEIIAAALAGYGTAGGAARERNQRKGNEGSGAFKGKKYDVGNVKPWVQEAADYLGSKYKIKTILGWGTRGNATDHDDGLALDFMTSGEAGYKIAREAIAKQKLLDVKYVIWKQKINSLDGRGWRGMEDRGSPTANHMDHVHISFDSSGKVDDLVNYGGRNGGRKGGRNYGAGVRNDVREVASRFGWDTGRQWDALVELVHRESSWRVNAANPNSSARGLFQKMTSLHGPVEQDATGQARWGLNYIEDRYGNPVKALQHHNQNGSYEKGVWELDKDQTAKVHKGEMIIDALKARQIREVMLNNNSYGAVTKGGGGITITFQDGAIQVNLTGADTRQPELAGRRIVDAFLADQRIQQLAEGR